MTSEQEPTRGRRKRPRVVAPPQHLEHRVRLTGSYSPVPHSDSVVRALAEPQAAAGSPTGAAGRTPQRSADPLAEFVARTRTRDCGAKPKEDLAELMKREKPPHWG